VTYLERNPALLNDLKKIQTALDTINDESKKIELITLKSKLLEATKQIDRSVFDIAFNKSIGFSTHVSARLQLKKIREKIEDIINS